MPLQHSSNERKRESKKFNLTIANSRVRKEETKGTLSKLFIEHHWLNKVVRKRDCLFLQEYLNKPLQIKRQMFHKAFFKMDEWG